MTSSVLNTDFTNANVNGNAKQVLIVASPSKKAVMYIGRDHKGHKGVAGTDMEPKDAPTPPGNAALQEPTGWCRTGSGDGESF